MLKGPLMSGLGIARKDFFTLFFLLFNTFTWYYITLAMLRRFLDTFPVSDADALLIRAVFYAAVIGSTLAGAVIHRTRRLRFLYSWMLLGVIASLLPTVFLTQGLVWSLLLGVSFGLGIPVALAYFADRSALEGRGRISGIIFFLSNLFAPLFFVSFGMVSLEIAFTLLAFWRAIGLVVFYLLKPQENVTGEVIKRVSFSAIFANRAFLYYLVPWFMYSLIDQLERVVWANFLGANFPDLNTLLGLGAPVVGAFAALLGGLLADWIGRKRVVIYGFVALGLAYAIVGIAPMLRFSWYVYLVGDGIAGGAFLAIFILTLWGDLAQPGAQEKYYVIGNLPFYIAAFVPLFLDSYVRSVPPSASFSLASFFLFISVLPLLYATETLPEKKIELRRLKGYIEQAKKLGEKYAKKK